MDSHELPPNYYRVSAKALILDEQNRFLLCREDNDMWEHPGGGIDYGETAHECLVREIREEMDLEVTSIAEQPSYFVTAQNLDGSWKVNVFYKTTVKNLEFTPSEECEEIRFVNLEEAAKMKLHPVAKSFTGVFNPAHFSALIP